MTDLRSGCGIAIANQARPASAADLPAPEMRSFGICEGWRVAVAVPARNEEQRLAECLASVAASLGDRGGIVVNVNGSSDNTVQVALDWFARSAARGIVLQDATPPPGSGVGRARNLTLQAGADCLAQGGVLMTTDADGRVDPGWVAANLAELARADLVCGLVAPDPDEYAALPGEVARRGMVEGEYIALLTRLQRLVDPEAYPPVETHRNAAGASLAFTLPLYRDLGGMPDVEEREDRIFVDLAQARGWRVCYSSGPRVTASCRLDGRTPGGMAAALRARIFDADPVCDEIIELPESALARAASRLNPVSPTARMPAPERLRLSQVAAALPRLRDLVTELERKDASP